MLRLIAEEEGQGRWREACESKCTERTDKDRYRAGTEIWPRGERERMH